MQYLPPEMYAQFVVRSPQAYIDSALTPKADVYAFGIVVWELLEACDLDDFGQCSDEEDGIDTNLCNTNPVVAGTTSRRDGNALLSCAQYVSLPHKASFRTSRQDSPSDLETKYAPRLLSLLLSL